MFLIYIGITLIILDVLILSHEFGHFITARRFGIRVNEFALGIGPKILSYQGKNTLFTIRAFPIGGFCSLQEETGPETESVMLLDGSYEEIPVRKVEIDPKESFENRPSWQKIIVLAAGVTMNFIIGYLIIVLAYLIVGRTLPQALTGAVRIFFNFFGLIFLSFKMLFTGEAGLGDLTGPIGMVSIVEQYYNQGFVFLLLFTAMLSVNLGVVNLLPIPALDGGQITMLLIEKLKNKQLSIKLKESLIVISYFLIIGLTVYIAYNDILRI